MSVRRQNRSEPNTDTAHKRKASVVCRLLRLGVLPFSVIVGMSCGAVGSVAEMSPGTGTSAEWSAAAPGDPWLRQAALAAAATDARQRGGSRRGAQRAARRVGALQLSYHAVSGFPKDANDALWPREIANPPAVPGTSLAVYSVRFDEGSRTVLLSAAWQVAPACGDAPNGTRVTIEYAVCTGKMVIIEGGRAVAVQATEPLCIEAVNDGRLHAGGPEWQDPARWGTRDRYDGTVGTIQLATMEGGRAVRACAKTLKAQ